MKKFRAKMEDKEKIEEELEKTFKENFDNTQFQKLTMREINSDTEKDYVLSHIFIRGMANEGELKEQGISMLGFDKFPTKEPSGIKKIHVSFNDKFLKKIKEVDE